MRRIFWPGVLLGLLSLVFLWTTLRFGGTPDRDWYVSLACLGALLAASSVSGTDPAPGIKRLIRWPAVVLFLVVVIQAVPLPFGLLESLSPHRVHISRAVLQIF